MGPYRHAACRAVLALAAIVPLAATLQAQVRREPVAGFTHAADTQTADLFGPGGIFTIAGGVVLHGDATFFEERDGRDLAVPASSIAASLTPDGALLLRHDGEAARLQMPQGIACPLGRFTERDGSIAFTVPRLLTAQTLRLARQAGLAGNRIAREFDNTQFEPLLRAADFGRTVELPSGLAERIRLAINHHNGLEALRLDADGAESLVGSFLNADPQVTYHVYLMAASGRADIGGVPLRYYWGLERGAAAVFDVDVMAQDWPAGSKLSLAGATPTQYDVVAFYQLAGLFRALHQANPTAFDGFVGTACGSPAATAM